MQPASTCRIYRVASALDEYFRTPLSGTSNSFDRWEYNYVVTALPGRGLRIVLTLLRGEKHGRKGDEYTYNPVDAMRVIDVGAEP